MRAAEDLSVDSKASLSEWSWHIVGVLHPSGHLLGLLFHLYSLRVILFAQVVILLLFKVISFYLGSFCNYL